MPQITSNISLVLNGVTPLNFGRGQVIQWDERYIEVVPISMPGGLSASPTATLTLAGNWDWVFAIRFGGTPGVRAVINDTATGERGMDYVRFSKAGGTINLIATEVGMIAGGSGVDVVNLGRAFTRTVDLGDGNDVVLTRSGGVGFIGTGAGNDRVTVGAGGADSVSLGDGNNLLTSATGWVGSILAHDGNDTASIGAAGAGTVRLGDGINVVNATGYVGAILTGDGNDRVTIGAAGANAIATGGGNDLVRTGTGYGGAISVGDGNDTVFVGSGGARVVALSGGDDTVTVSRMSDPTNGVFVAGGQGEDTINLAAFAGNFEILFEQAFDTGNGILVVGTSVEKVIGGIGANSFVGSSADNTFFGGAGNDRLDGGLGNDTLRGDAGADAFAFEDTPAAANSDDVLDFNRAQRDTIQLASWIFDELGDAGRLNAQFFRAGAAALDANDYVIYNRATGVLSYDADGNGAGAAVEIATFTNKAIIAVADFLVI